MQLLAICTVESERLKVFERSLRSFDCRKLRSHESLANVCQLIIRGAGTPKPTNPALAFRPGFHPLIYNRSALAPDQQDAHHWIARWPRHPDEENAKWLAAWWPGFIAFKKDGLLPPERFRWHSCAFGSTNGCVVPLRPAHAARKSERPHRAT